MIWCSQTYGSMNVYCKTTRLHHPTFPRCSMGLESLSTWMAEFYEINEGKYSILPCSVWVWYLILYMSSIVLGKWYVHSFLYLPLIEAIYLSVFFIVFFKTQVSNRVVVVMDFTYFWKLGLKNPLSRDNWVYPLTVYSIPMVFIVLSRDSWGS